MTRKNPMMVRLFRHKWKKAEDSRKLKHFICEKCGCEKWWDAGFQRTIYSVKGRIYYRSLGCNN